MKKVLFTLVCLVAMMAASTSLKAQEISITLIPGWTWISNPTTDTLDFATALGSFTPMAGDAIKSQWGNAYYRNGRWAGSISQFYPGYGYKYYSNRTTPVTLTFNVQQPTPQVVVTTSEPTDVTSNSATCGGNVASSNGDFVSVTLRGICWGFNPNPTFNDNYIEAGNGLGSFTVSMTDLPLNTTFYVRAFAVTPTGTFYGNGVVLSTYEYVDLGLPSGTLWATCNVGATTPEGYGDYFAWGDTQPKDYYEWSTYQYCHGSNYTLTKYCNNSYYGYNGFSDDLTVLLPEDDAATANWGDDWRMPTEEEWEELYQNTTCVWINQNGVNGRLFTASNGNSLFLPASGFRSGSELNDVGIRGIYRSSSLYLEAPYNTWGFAYGSQYCTLSSLSKASGTSVRPVRSIPQNNAPIGAVNGKFTINEEGDQIYFSQGNLQYQASTNTWRFADNQYDCIGGNNSSISPTYDGWIDLFGWGTSGYNHGAVCYQPWSTSTEYSDYYAYGIYNYNLNDQTGQADWGYNAISNGGGQENQWRTLTQPEWDYVINTRTTTSGIRYAKAKVNYINGVILLPDDWCSDTYNLNNTNSNVAGYSSNTLTASQWSSLEQAGAVFLPAAGLRSETSVGYVTTNGYYWSASYSNSSEARLVGFYNSEFSSGSYSTRDHAFSVRLAQSVQ